MVRPPRSATSRSASARSASPAVTPKTQPARRGRSTSVPVKVIAGCRAIGARADGGGRLEDGEAVATGGVDDVLALADRAGRAEHRDHVGEHVVGDGEQQEVAGAGDVGGLGDGYAGQQGRDAPAGGVGLAGGGDDLVARAAEGGGQGRRRRDRRRWRRPAGPCWAGSSGANLSFQSRCPPMGQVWVPLDVLVTASRVRRAKRPCEQSVNVTYPTPTVDRRAGVRPSGRVSAESGAQVQLGVVGVVDGERARGAGQPRVGDVVDDVHARRAPRSR